MAMNQIKHLVVLMMENRSFDHYFGMLNREPGFEDVNGLPDPLPQLHDLDPGGQIYQPFAIDGISPGYPDPPHGWGPAHADFNGRKNDGFVEQYQTALAEQNLPNLPANRQIPMGYYTQATLPVYYELVNNFALCDAWFGSVLSSTWPNRKYLYSSQRDGDNDTHMIPPFPGFGTTPFLKAIEQAPDPDNPGSKLSWKCYYSDLPFLAFWYEFAAFHAFSGHFASVADFVADCQSGTLPTISMIDPAFSIADDHPSHDPALGQKFVGLIVDAISHSQSWESTALVIVYDENGGFYDHQVPPAVAANANTPEDNNLGFRVPAIVVSAYTPKGVVNTQFDHSSIMKSISERWDVRFDNEYGSRWTTANSIWADCIGSVIVNPRGTYTGAEAAFSDLNWGSGSHDLLSMPVHDLLGSLERLFILESLKKLDQRANVFDNLNTLENRVVTLKRLHNSLSGG